MATRVWTGAAGDGNWNTVGNWAGGVVPTGTAVDDVIVSRDATYGMSANLNRSGDNVGAGLNLTRFKIEAGFAYDIGTFAAPLRLTTDKFVDNGNGNVYFQSDTGTSAFATDWVIVDKDGFGKTVYLTSSGDSNMTRIDLMRGTNVLIGDEVASMTVTQLWITPRWSNEELIVTGNSLITAQYVYIGGGTFVVDGVETTIVNLGNGQVDFRKSAIAQLNQTGGLFRHNGEAANYAVSLYNAVGGAMETLETPGTKLISTLYRAPNWTYTYNPDLVITTPNYIGG